MVSVCVKTRVRKTPPNLLNQRERNTLFCSIKWALSGATCHLKYIVTDTLGETHESSWLLSNTRGYWVHCGYCTQWPHLHNLFKIAPLFHIFGIFWGKKFFFQKMTKNKILPLLQRWPNYRWALMSTHFKDIKRQVCLLKLGDIAITFSLQNFYTTTCVTLRTIYHNLPTSGLNRSLLRWAVSNDLDKWRPHRPPWELLHYN